MHLRRPVGLVALAAMSSSLLALAAPPAAASVDPDGTIFLNEIHYDNASTDVGESVEIAGPVGTDLAGWSVVLYNGNPSTAAATYGTRTLTGTIPASGVVTVDYPLNGLQNGAPDGLALVDAQGDVQQLLSYEGVLTASNGPASGLTSTDIGVAEDGSEPIGLSLQLTGTGSAYGDFTWTGPVAATPGALNAGQVLQPADPDAPALPVATCEPELVTPQGTAATSALSAVDEDSLVTSITLTSPPVDGISLTGVVLSGGTGAAATADLVVSDQVAQGDYAVVVEFATDSGQTATCTVDVAVTPSTATPISTVQGSGATSPLVGQEVLVEGVVVGDYQERGEFGGFYVQSLSPDADPLTSEGLRVFSFATPVEVGDLVRVVGTVSEFASSSNLYSGSETQLAPVRSIEVIGDATVPSPTAVTLPFAQPVEGVDGQERYEGMLATLTNTDLVATDLYTLGRFGEVSLTTGEVLYIPTSAEQAAANDADRITLDDGLSGQNLDALPYTIGGDGITLPRAGDLVVDPVTGVLTFSFGEWRIVPAVGTQIDFARSEPRPEAPDEVGGDVQIASFNVLNYFVDFGGQNRGANDAEELQRQQDKLVAAITGLDADVVGLIEIANDDGDALETLVAALNAAQPDPADHYTAVQAPALNEPTGLGGTYGTDAIRQAIIYRAAVVTPVGATPSDPALLNPADPLFPDEPVFDRPPAVQTFVPVGGNREFTVVVNHFKSKGSNNDQCGTPDPFGGNCDDLRERQSAALVDLVEALGVKDVALLGDFNSYESEEPIQVLEDAGYVSVVADQPRDERTSYSFDGEFGSLDYIFLSRSLAKVQTGADIWQINSPEAVALDYNDFNQEQLYAPGPYASSDHDPVLVGLDLVPALQDGARPGRPAAPGRPSEPGRPDGAGRPAEPGPPPFAGTSARRGMTER